MIGILNLPTGCLSSPHHRNHRVVVPHKLPGFLGCTRTFSKQTSWLYYGHAIGNIWDELQMSVGKLIFKTLTLQD